MRYQEVAKAAGINTATLFYYFPSKEELIRGVMQHLKEEFSQTPGRPVDKPTTALEELRLDFESISNLMQKHPKLFLVHAEISLRALRDPLIENELRGLDHLWKQHLMRIGAIGAAVRNRIPSVYGKVLALYPGTGLRICACARENWLAMRA